VVNKANAQATDPFATASLTYDGPNPSLLGGKEINISLVFPRRAVDVWVDVISYGTDVYILRVMAPRDQWERIEPYRQAIVKTLDFVRAGDEPPVLSARKERQAPSVSNASGDYEKLVGVWTGRISGRHPITGNPVNLDFRFEFLPDGTYKEWVGSGDFAFLNAEGKFSLRRRSDRTNPNVTHLVTFAPQSFTREPSLQEAMIIESLQLPNTSQSDHSLFFYDLSGGGATLKRINGNNSWGLQRDAAQ